MAEKTVLRLDASDEPETFKIDGSHPCFAGTSYAGIEGFSVTVRRATRMGLSSIQARHTKSVRGVAKTDDGAVSLDLFVDHVTAWEGIGDKDGNALECNRENKRKVANKELTFTSCISAAIIDKDAEGAQAREEAQKNS